MKLPELLKRDYVKSIIMIVAVIAIVMLFWYTLSFVLGTEHPVLAVASESMEPVLYKGDLIIVEGVQNVSAIHVGTKDASVPGDIIIFYKPYDPTERIVHRAVEKIDNGDDTYSFKTWGDNNDYPDPWTINESALIGRYIAKIPWLGNIALAFADFTVKVALVVLCVVVLILVEFLPIVLQKRKRDETKQAFINSSAEN
ncbi:MAG: signal peptidase I [Candidatus Bathyarchaeia archaeon]|jgi:signal peptidase